MKMSADVPNLYESSSNDDRARHLNYIGNTKQFSFNGIAGALWCVGVCVCVLWRCICANVDLYYSTIQFCWCNYSKHATGRTKSMALREWIRNFEHILAQHHIVCSQKSEHHPGTHKQWPDIVVYSFSAAFGVRSITTSAAASRDALNHVNAFA